jgi:hypothetical protein
MLMQPIPCKRHIKVLTPEFMITKKCLAHFSALAVLVATSAITSNAQTLVYSNIWNIAPGSRAYVTSGVTERGIALNPVNTNVLIASRGSGNIVAVLNSADGSFIRNLSTVGISGGTFALNKVQVADDGAVYAANLRAANGSGNLKVYRWASDSDPNPPTTIIDQDLGDGITLRWGDSMAIRGGGAGTQIFISGSSNTKAVMLVTADGTNFTPLVVTLTGAGVWQKGLSFGAGNTMYAKLSADSTVKLYSFNTNTLTSALVSSYAGYDSTMVALHVDLARNILAGPLTANTTLQADHRLRVYDITAPASPVLAYSTNFPSPYFADSNLAGEAAIYGDKIVSISCANGVVALKISVVTAALPPAITSQPAASTNLQGGFATFKVSANGTQPLRYQWYFNTTSTPIAGANTNVFVVNNLTSANQGNYFVVITNSALTGNSVTSSAAFLAVSNSVLSTWLTPLYQVTTGSRTYLADDNNQRGLAYNPQANHLLVTSRTPANGIYVLNGNTGADLNSMDVSAVTGGDGNALNLIGVADDGVVFACNLRNSSGNFKVYRWANDSAGTPSTTIVDEAVAARLGDSMDVRGAGLDTQLIFGEQAGGKVHIFTTTDGTTFTEQILTSDATTETSRNGLAFGRGNTYWSKDFGGNLREMAFDLSSSTATTLGLFLSDYTMPSSIQPVGYDPQNDLLASIAIASGAVSPGPDNVRLYDVANLTPNQPIWLDTEFFGTGNVNSFGTGALDFGNGRLYTDDSHNGIAVFTVNVTNGAPVITVQPQSRTNNVGQNAIFGVNATGYPHSYYWLSNGVPEYDNTNASLVLVNGQSSYTANYQVVISNVSGVVTSSVAQLWFRPVITSQPQSVVANPNDFVSFFVGADGSPDLKYQWRKDGNNLTGQTDATYSIPSAQVSDAGNYTVVVTNAAGAVTSAVATLNVVIPSNPGDGTGLTGDYYNNHSTNAFSGAPVLTRVDPLIDFDWGVGSPDPLVVTDFFTIRWTGKVQPLYTQNYTFYTKTDDGVRLWVNGQKLVDKWVLQGATEWSGTISLTADQKYDIVMEYFENQVAANAQLSWSSASQVKGVIPQQQLFPSTGAATPTLSVSVSGTNFVLNWGPGSYPVLWSTNVLGPYTNIINGAISPLSIPISPSIPQKFFRLQTQ